MLINGLKVYELLVDDVEGMYTISLVNSPAVETGWLAFSKDEKPDTKKMNFAVVNEDEKKIFGVVCRADFPIYRYNEKTGEEYYVVFSKETIRKMSQKFFKGGFQNEINLEHQSDMYVNCVEIQEMFIKDVEKGINPKDFEDTEDGSLFALYQITNDKLWELVKDGTFTGFSLEGYFSMIEKEEDDEPVINSLRDLLNVLK